MIKIRIEREITETYTEPVNYITHSEPAKDAQGNVAYETDESYDSRTKKKAITANDYKVEQVTKTRSRTVTLLAQEVEDEKSFVLGVVIMAINGMIPEGTQSVITLEKGKERY
jgi:hypothetical protein